MASRVARGYRPNDRHGNLRETTKVPKPVPVTGTMRPVTANNVILTSELALGFFDRPLLFVVESKPVPARGKKEE